MLPLSTTTYAQGEQRILSPASLAEASSQQDPDLGLIKSWGQADAQSPLVVSRLLVGLAEIMYETRWMQCVACQANTRITLKRSLDIKFMFSSDPNIL
jgi:hypothetical protein